MRALTISVLVVLAYVLKTAEAAESAWNGHISPGSTTPADFTPFYVPSGSSSVDSSSQRIYHSRAWNTSFSSAYVGGSALTTSTKGAYLSLNFTGSGIELYGGKGKRYGSADIYLDGNFLRSISNFDNRDRQQQLLFFSYNLQHSSHTIKIVNSGSVAGSVLLIDAFVISDYATDPAPSSAQLSQPSFLAPMQKNSKVAIVQNQVSNQQWSLVQNGSTGVAAMQLAIISSTHAIIIDKVEHNPLTVDGHPAWGALYNLDTHSVKPLNMQSNSFCAGGAYLSNGTLVNVGGNPVVSDKTASADFGDLDGLQAIRLFHPCESENVDSCDIYENHARIRMASPRWYNTVTRISDGSAIIIGGSKKGGWINNATVNNPTVEYYPPKNIQGSNGMPITLALLKDTLNSNLFPIVFPLPDGKIFIAANQEATIYDWQANTEQRLPKIPNGVRVTYPMTGTGLLLPLSAENNYTPEVLLCGGSAVDDTKPGYELNSQDPASSQCSRIVLTDEGIQAGWQVEQMPQARVMPDAVQLPTGQILIVNGGGTGISGYANVIDQVGQSNADNPVLTPVLYDPLAPAGSRFTQAGLPASTIPRLYHSVATLTGRGDVMVAGSNPNLDRSAERYGTEYRVEWFRPPYTDGPRPKIVKAPTMVGLGETMKMEVEMPQTSGANTAATGNVKVVCMDLGYVTHAVHAGARMVYLVSGTLSNTGSDSKQTVELEVTGPPDAGVYPPGPAWLFLVIDGIPSEGVRVMIGDGRGPPVDEGALKNVLENTQVDQYDKDKKSGEDDNDSE